MAKISLKIRLMIKPLSKKINKLAREDLTMRKRFDRADIYKKLDQRNTRELKQIVRNYGWPTVQLVGKKSSQYAWLLAQHADLDRKFQKRVLDLLIAADKKQKGSVNRANIAFLIDRLLMAQKKKQVFGTQFVYFGKLKKLKLYPVKNRKNINKLRKDYNLPPLEDYLKSAEEYNRTKINLQG